MSFFLYLANSHFELQNCSNLHLKKEFNISAYKRIQFNRIRSTDLGTLNTRWRQSWLHIVTWCHTATVPHKKKTQPTLYLRASFQLDSTFGDDTQGNFSFGFCPQCSHYAQRRDNYGGLLSERGWQTMHTIWTALDSETRKKEERAHNEEKHDEGLLTINMVSPRH